MKPIDVKNTTYADFGKEVNDTDPKFKAGDHVRIYPKYILHIGLKKFLLKKLKIQFYGYVINDLNGKEIIRTFYEKELQKIDQEEFRIEKVIRKKGDKLYVK